MCNGNKTKHGQVRLGHTNQLTSTVWRWEMPADDPDIRASDGECSVHLSASSNRPQVV